MERTAQGTLLASGRLLRGGRTRPGLCPQVLLAVATAVHLESGPLSPSQCLGG